MHRVLNIIMLQIQVWETLILVLFLLVLLMQLLNRIKDCCFCLSLINSSCYCCHLIQLMWSRCNVCFFVDVLSMDWCIKLSEFAVVCNVEKDAISNNLKQCVCVLIDAIFRPIVVCSQNVYWYELHGLLWVTCTNDEDAHAVEWQCHVVCTIACKAICKTCVAKLVTCIRCEIYGTHPQFFDVNILIARVQYKTDRPNYVQNICLLEKKHTHMKTNTTPTAIHR